MEKREREIVRTHACTHTHWIGKGGEDARVS